MSGIPPITAGLVPGNESCFSYGVINAWKSPDAGCIITNIPQAPTLLKTCCPKDAPLFTLQGSYKDCLVGCSLGHPQDFKKETTRIENCFTDNSLDADDVFDSACKAAENSAGGVRGPGVMVLAGLVAVWGWMGWMGGL